MGVTIPERSCAVYLPSAFEPQGQPRSGAQRNRVRSSWQRVGQMIGGGEMKASA